MKRTNHWTHEEKIDILRSNGVGELASSTLATVLNGMTFRQLDEVKKALRLITKDSETYRKEFDVLDKWYK
jgi:hypothetical protein